MNCLPTCVPLSNYHDAHCDKRDIASDTVNHPPHYKSGGMETIDVIEAFKLNFNLGNALKYITRAGRKGSYVEDLRKAIWYLGREISKSDAK